MRLLYNNISQEIYYHISGKIRYSFKLKLIIYQRIIIVWGQYSVVCNFVKYEKCIITGR